MKYFVYFPERLAYGDIEFDSILEIFDTEEAAKKFVGDENQERGNGIHRLEGDIIKGEYIR